MIRVYSDTDVRIEDPLAIYVAQDGLYVSAALFDENKEFNTVVPAQTVMAILNLDKSVAVADVTTTAGSVPNVVIGTFPAGSVANLSEGYYHVRIRTTVSSVPSTFKLTKIKILKVP